MEEDGAKTLKVRGSRKIYIPVYLMIIILILTLASAKFMGKEVNNAALRLIVGFVVAGFFITEIHRFGSWYEVNTNSLVVSRGILSRTTRRVDLVSVSDADTRQRMWQRMLNYGDVRARLFSKETTVLIKNINNPSRFVDFLEKNMNSKKEGSSGGF
ncbi:MAG TPA: PH domain-containing protein [Candidatus Nanoarchaeia archaeon]|nr:PH domain-containing protein [Candidatus Nanoarchaeia archaeon]